MSDLDLSMLSKAMPVQQVVEVRRCLQSPASYKNHMHQFQPSTKQVAQVALKKLEEAHAVDVSIHEANIEAIANNIQLREQITVLMDHIGIPKNWFRYDPKSRARHPKRLREEPGYIGDLKRNVLIDDGFTMSTGAYNQLKAEYEKFAAQAEQEDLQAQKHKNQENERKKSERRANLTLADIIRRYELDVDIEWDAILENLRKRNKYLDLAIAGIQTRGDWSEGYHRVSAALDSFTIENDQDKDIATDLCDCLQSAEDGVDGRIFRDTTWNYDRLLGLVPDPLRENAMFAYSKVSEGI